MWVCGCVGEKSSCDLGPLVTWVTSWQQAHSPTSFPCCCLTQCRDEWISSLIDELDDSQDAYEHVKHLTDIHRLYLFDAIMQYRAIFFGGSTSVPGAGASGQSHSAATASLLQVG